jgi:hypothetical protein
LKFSDAIGQVLGSRIDDVLSVPPPTWLARFVTASHVRKATVITFNYDTLVECAVDYRNIYLPTLAEPVAWTEVTGDVPGWPAGTMRYGATPVDTFRRLKLHGERQRPQLRHEITLRVSLIGTQFLARQSARTRSPAGALLPWR